MPIRELAGAEQPAERSAFARWPSVPLQRVFVCLWVRLRGRGEMLPAQCMRSAIKVFPSYLFPYPARFA